MAAPAQKSFQHNSDDHQEDKASKRLSYTSSTQNRESRNNHVLLFKLSSKEKQNVSKKQKAPIGCWNDKMPKTSQNVICPNIRSIKSQNSHLIGPSSSFTRQQDEGSDYPLPFASAELFILPFEIQRPS
jgi:hypothetical protein